MYKYEKVIGLEVHVELSTKSKIFCGCSTEFGGRPNSKCCPICMGMPGTLPVLNRRVLEYAIATGLATGCTIREYSRFDRKNYFYPDLPKSYQTSQLYLPICYEGSLEIEVDGIKKKIGIHEIHMEEDAGKLIHDQDDEFSFIDYNRSGVPLIEIVTKPDMNSKEEVIAFLEKLQLILEYLGVSDCKMQEGSFRADINLSVRKKGQKELGTRTEMKNINSFKAIGRAIDYEAKRQIDLLEKGESIEQETRRWDDANGISLSLRSKINAKDYRYFPDPDLPPLVVDKDWVDEIRKRQPELREEKIQRYMKEFKLPEYDAKILTSSKYLADIFEKTVAISKNPKEVSNWIMIETMRLMRDRQVQVENITFSPENLARLIELVEAGKINRTIAKEIFELIFDEDIDPEVYVKEHQLGVVDDRDLLIKVVQEVIRDFPDSVTDYKSGKDKAFKHLMGQIMKRMKGKANPVLVNELLRSELEEL
ncbi:MAG: Asp-tRNA(Asn)/Glu-tRNA(Gln) amidotransferase subunit GatB [Clostridiales bacterium]|nr:Asp-tRNA(Asn)/Glu-tRNA(Gln) amidotransferase subunit GatB [Clostridiales bacterium]